MYLARPCGMLSIASLFCTITAGSFAQTNSQPQSSPLAGTSWQLVHFQSSDDMTLTPDDEAKYTLTFAPDGRLTGQFDCNRGMGTWTSSGSNNLRFGPIALSRAMCASTPLNKRLPRDLDYVRTYTMKNGHLFLALMADGGIYEFEPESTASSTTQSPQLENTTWQLTQLGDKSIPDPQHGPNFTLDSSEHRVSGSGGCNRIMGGYTLEGNNLKFTHMASSMMACISDFDVERPFLDALNQINSWKITGNQLQLQDASGKILATFQPAKE
jgi:heat shock protein HslJ